METGHVFTPDSPDRSRPGVGFDVTLILGSVRESFELDQILGNVSPLLRRHPVDVPGSRPPRRRKRRDRTAWRRRHSLEHPNRITLPSGSATCISRMPHGMSAGGCLIMAPLREISPRGRSPDRSAHTQLPASSDAYRNVAHWIAR